MPDPRPSLADYQLTVIRAFLRHRIPLVELIDHFDAEAKVHHFTIDPGRSSTRTKQPDYRVDERGWSQHGSRS